MSKVMHFLLHALAIFAGAGSIATGLVPEKYAPLIMAVQGAAQAIIGLTNHKAAQ